MKVTRRRSSTRLGPLRINWSGWRVTSVTCALVPGYRLTVWKAARR